MDQSPVMQILIHTPTWVWFVFVALAISGYQQSRDRSITAARLFILPIVMVLLAIYGVTSTFGFSFLALLVWNVGFALPILVAVPFLTPKGASYSPNGFFHIPGSWFPLALMMVIFSIKYFLGVASARHLSMIADPWFIGLIGILLGLLSGTFMARNIGIMRFRLLELRHP